MKVFKRTVMSLLGLALLATGSTVQAANNADIAKIMPKDCWAFVAVRSINAIQERADMLTQLELGIPPMPPIAPMAQMQSGLGETLDLGRPIFVVAMDVKRFGSAGEDMPEDPTNALLAFIPATDSAAMIGKVAAAEGDGPVRQVMMMGQQLYAAPRDDYVVFGRSEKTVKAGVLKSNAGLELNRAQVDCLNACDIYISAGLSKGFEAYRQEVMGFMQMAMAATDPSGESAKTLEKQLSELAHVDFGIALSNDGFSLHTVVVPKKESDMEKLFGDMKNVDKSLLSAMPKETYLIAASGTTPYSVHQEKFGNQNIVSQIFKQMQAAGGAVEANEAAVKALDAELIKLQRSVDAFAMNMAALDGGDGGYLGASMILESREPKACLDSMRTIYTNLWKLSDDEDLKKAKTMLTHKPDAETIEGGKVDTIALKMEEFATETEMSEEDKKMFKKLLGNEVTIRFGVVGDNHLLVSFGGGQARYANTAKVIKSGGANLLSDPGITSSMSKMPSPRSMEGFISVENILRIAKTISTAMGEPDNIPFEIPDINAPIGMDSTMVDNAFRFDLIVPMKLVKGIKKAIDEQAKREMEAFDEEEEDVGEPVPVEGE